MKRIIRLLTITSVLFLLTACSLPGLGGSVDTDKTPITVAGVGSTEGLILNHMVEQLIEHYIDTDVQLLNNMATSPMLNVAMVQDDANVASVKYTGTSLTSELGLAPITDPDKALEVVVEGFAEEFNQKWYPSYGFENSYAFMVRKEVADELGLTKVSDLRPYADEMEAGVDTSWMEREGDGYRGFVEHYDIDFGNIYPMQIGLVYDAVANESVDIVLGYSTDGRVASYDLVVLEDDLNYFPPYDSSPSANYEILEEYPELDKILLKLEGKIPTELMQELNYISDDFLLEPATVADEFLKENNYFEDAEPYVEPLRLKEGGETP